MTVPKTFYVKGVEAKLQLLRALVGLLKFQMVRCAVGIQNQRLRGYV